MDCYYIGCEGGLKYLSSHKTLAGAKGWSAKYTAWRKNGAHRGSDIYIKSDNGMLVAMRIDGKWVCPETDARRRARLDA